MNEQILEMQEKSIEQIKSFQDQALELNERIAESITGILPELPQLPGPFAELPTPVEVVNNYFDFMTQVRDANVEFVQQMMATWAPEEAPAPTKAAPKKAAAKKTTAKKTTAKK